MLDKEYDLVQVAASGRVTIPADRRKERQIAEGDWVLIRAVKAEIRPKG